MTNAHQFLISHSQIDQNKAIESGSRNTSSGRYVGIVEDSQLFVSIVIPTFNQKKFN